MGDSKAETLYPRHILLVCTADVPGEGGAVSWQALQP